MKLTIPTKQLVAALKSLKPVAKYNTDHPILGNVALFADKKSLRLVAMDLEKRMELALSCKPKEAGSITLNCARLHERLSLRGEPDTEITTAEMTATIRTGKHTGNVPGLPVDEMPQWPELNGAAHKFTITAELLTEALTKCLVQSSLDYSRAVLKSVFFVSRKGLLNIQATNGQRLIIFYTSIPFDCGDTQFIIPRESVPTLAALAATGEVNFEMGENILSAGTDNARFSTKLIEGTMQDFEKAFPKDDKLGISVIANREQLINEIATAETYTTEASRSVSVRCDGSEITIKAAGADVGSGTGVLDAKKGSQEIEFACNPSYLREALSAFPDEDVILRFQDEKTPFIIRNELITAIVYPQRVA